MDPIITPPTGADAQTADAAAAAVTGDVPPVQPPADAQEDMIEATGGGFASKLKAGMKRLEDESTEEFDVPGWHGDMKIRAKKLTDAERKLANTTAATIVLATEAVLMRKTDDGPLEEIPGGWNGVAREMGRPGLSQSKVVRAVFDNGVRVDVFHSMLVAWMAGVQAEHEAELGE